MSKRVSDAIAQQIKASGGASVNQREFALLAADLLDSRQRNAELEQKVKELEADRARLNWIDKYKRKQDRWEIRTMKSPATIWLQSGCSRYPSDGSERMTVREAIDAARQKEAPNV